MQGCVPQLGTLGSGGWDNSPQASLRPALLPRFRAGAGRWGVGGCDSRAPGRAGAHHAVLGLGQRHLHLLGPRVLARRARPEVHRLLLLPLEPIGHRLDGGGPLLPAGCSGETPALPRARGLPGHGACAPYRSSGVSTWNVRSMTVVHCRQRMMKVLGRGRSVFISWHSKGRQRLSAQHPGPPTAGQTSPSLSLPPCKRGPELPSSWNPAES